MNKDFSRTITLLRKEKGFSQKKVADDLGISSALLSHYENGVRECGLDFVVKISDYYDVSCDYLLGKTPDRSGQRIVAEQVPDGETAKKENVFRGSILSTLNKKLILNSLHIIYDILEKSKDKMLTNAISAYFMVCVYKIFRILYSSDKKNPQDFFAVSPKMYKALSSATLTVLENDVDCAIAGFDIAKLKKSAKNLAIPLSTEIISKDYPLLASSLYSLVQRAENSLVKSPRA